MACRNTWLAVLAGGLLASGGAQAQVLDHVEAGVPCPSGIGCQIAMDSDQDTHPAQACQGEEAVTAQADGERLLVMIRSQEPPQSITGSLATLHIDQIAEACWAALGEVSIDEAREAIRKYSREFHEAAEVCNG
jgi:hypothetical protein